MTYIFDPDFTTEPQVYLGGFGDEFSADFRLGFQLDEAGGDRLVFMSCSLMRGFGFIPDRDDIYDLRFGIRTQHVDKDYDVSSMDYSHESSLMYVPSRRAEVLKFTYKTIGLVIQSVRPHLVTASTFYPDLEDKALEKYRNFEILISNSGYETIENYRSQDGFDRWVFGVKAPQVLVSSAEEA